MQRHCAHDGKVFDDKGYICNDEEFFNLMITDNDFRTFKVIQDNIKYSPSVDYYLPYVFNNSLKWVHYNRVNITKFDIIHSIGVFKKYFHIHNKN